MILKNINHLVLLIIKDSKLAIWFLGAFFARELHASAA